MQLYAFDGAQLVLAGKAEKGKNYACPECQSSVRVRSGPSRQIHFYHLSLPKQCRQHEKSEEHIQLQLKILDLIGAEDAHIEYPFSAIRRVADVAWTTKKIVFEIQCSPISLEEAQCRTLDYASLGYQVIWILHENRFNQKNLSAAENFLRNIPCYFTDIDKSGFGTVYDQFEVIKKNKRLFKGPPLIVSIEKFSQIPSVASSDLMLPETVQIRLVKWKCFMEGDLLHRLLKEGHLSQSAKKMINIERQILGKRTEGLKSLPLKQLFTKSYRSIIDCLLKAFSRH